MKHSSLLAVGALLLTLGVTQTAEAGGEDVGLGVAAGVAMPDSNVDYDPTLNWGFFVDIPLMRTFQISPSAILYKLKVGEAEQPAVDVSLNFKFIVPIRAIELYIGFTGGVTSASHQDVHVGAFGGLAVRAVSNLDIFAQLNYRLVLQDGEDIRNLLLFFGPRFRF